MDFYKVPLGFGMALCQNFDAMNAYSCMRDEEKEALVNKARNAKSEQEMHDLVNGIAGRML